MAEQIGILVAFSAGLLSFLSPCVLPLVPAYLASLYGAEIFEPAAGRNRMPVFLHSLSFVIGFSIVFSLWGAGAGLLGSALAAYLYLVRSIAGGLLVFFGLLMLVALKVPWLNYEKRLKLPVGGGTGYLRSLLIGGAFCVAWTPCLGWQIMAILSLAGSSGTVWKGTYLLAIYSLGLGIPFLIIGATFDSITPFLKHIHRYGTAIYIVSSILLISVGVLILTGKLVWL